MSDDILKKKPIQFEVGETYELTLMDGKFGSKTIHIISIIDDELILHGQKVRTRIIAFRWFYKDKDRWFYDIKDNHALSYEVRHHKKMKLIFDKKSKS